MSANISEVDGRAEMMYVGETPWHGLGTKLNNPATAKEALIAAHLDWEVRCEPIYTKLFSGELREVENHFATVRMDTRQALGVVGNRYTPIQNHQGFSVGDILVGEGAAIYETAGALGIGQKVWMLARLPGHIKVHGDDIVDKYLLFTTSHDGSSSGQVLLTPIRVVCNNTLTMALQGSEKRVFIRHTASAQSKLDTAHKILGLSNALFDKVGEIYAQMFNCKLTVPATTKYVANLFPFNDDMTNLNAVTEKRNEVLELVETGRGANEHTKGTLWGAYNAVTEYVDHERKGRGDQSSRLNSIWFGGGAELKQRAMESAIDVLKN